MTSVQEATPEWKASKEFRKPPKSGDEKRRGKPPLCLFFFVIFHYYLGLALRSYNISHATRKDWDSWGTHWIAKQWAWETPVVKGWEGLWWESIPDTELCTISITTQFLVSEIVPGWRPTNSICSSVNYHVAPLCCCVMNAFTRLSLSHPTTHKLVTIEITRLL